MFSLINKLIFLQTKKYKHKLIKTITLILLKNIINKNNKMFL